MLLFILTFTRVYMLGELGGAVCLGEGLCGGSRGGTVRELREELCACGVLCCVVGWGACTPVTRWSRHAHTIASSTPSTRGIHSTISLYNCSRLAPPPCPRPQQQPGSPLQSVPTSPTACSSACAPSSVLSR